MLRRSDRRARAGRYTYVDMRTDCWADKGFYSIVCLVAFVQGSTQLSRLAMQYFFKVRVAASAARRGARRALTDRAQDDLHIGPATMSIIMGLILVPWVIKPLYGFVSDSFPILGRRRMPYFFIFGATGFLGWMLLAYAAEDVYFAVAMLMLSSLSLAFVNVLAEALIVERGGQQKGDADRVKERVSMLMTLYWGTESVAKIITGYLSGLLVEKIPKRDIFQMTAVFPALLCFMAFFLQERRSEKKRSITVQWDVLIGHLSHPYIWKPAVFMFIFMATPTSQASYFYFLTNDIKLNPEFMGTLTLVEGVSSLIGLTLYHAFLSKVSYRNILYWVIVASFVAGLSPLILITHVNRDWGIPDRWFVVGDTAVLAGIGQVAIMPLLILGAQTCPKAVEGTLYALLMSTLNIGGVVSDNLGGLLTWVLGITSDNFSNLWLLVLICNIANLIPIPFLYVLVPTEEQLHEFHRDSRKAQEEEDRDREPIMDKDEHIAD